MTRHTTRRFFKQTFGIIIGIIVLCVIGYILINRSAVMEPKNKGMEVLSVGFANDQLEQTLSNYLLAQKEFSWKTREGSINVCVVENLGSTDDLFPLYIWGYCGEYVMKNNIPVHVSGWSGPVKITYPNELSFYDPTRFTHEVPRDGSYNTTDIKRMFPQGIQQKIFSFDSAPMIRRAEGMVFQNTQ